ncbi:unnamed protein product [Amaranthus hypochondriacus]
MSKSGNGEFYKTLQRQLVEGNATIRYLKSQLEIQLKLEECELKRLRECGEFYQGILGYAIDCGDWDLVEDVGPRRDRAMRAYRTLKIKIDALKEALLKTQEVRVPKIFPDHPPPPMETPSPLLPSPNTPKHPELEPQEVNNLVDRETVQKCAPLPLLTPIMQQLEKKCAKDVNKDKQWSLCIHDYVGEIHSQVQSLRTNFSKEKENDIDQPSPILTIPKINLFNIWVWFSLSYKLNFRLFEVHKINTNLLLVL